jgi:hypothetical protein
MSRRFQFSLRALLLAVTVFAVWLGWLAERTRKKSEAIRAIQQIGGAVSDDEPCAVCFYSSNDNVHWGEDVEFKPLADAEIQAVIPQLEILSPSVVYLRDVPSKSGSATFSHALNKRLSTALPGCSVITIEPFSLWMFPNSPRK